LACAVFTRCISALMTDDDWPFSMSKSTPTRFEEFQRLMKVDMPESLEQVKVPPAPPVEMMYFAPSETSLDLLAEAVAAPSAPLQFSLPHEPVAKASVTVVAPRALMSVPMSRVEPETLVRITLLFQSKASHVPL